MTLELNKILKSYTDFYLNNKALVDLIGHENSAPSYQHKLFLVVDQLRVSVILEPV